MDKYEHAIYKYIRDNKLINAGDYIIVGFSGGPDSVCLLNVLNDLKNVLRIHLKAIHVNHGLRGEEAKRDEDFALEFAGKLGIDFKAVNVDVRALVKSLGLSEEEAARILRYKALNDAAIEFKREIEEKNGIECADKPVANKDSIEKNADTAKRAFFTDSKDTEKYSEVDAKVKIAVAHHADDEAETVLFNIMRGSSLKGVVGMLPLRENIIRPLLCMNKANISAYLMKHDLSFVLDSTNESTDHTRNIIRHNILPLLNKDVNAASSEHIVNMAMDIREADEFIRDEALKILDKIDDCGVKEENGVLTAFIKIPHGGFNDLAHILRIYVIIEALKLIKVPLKDWGRVHFEDIDKALFKPKGFHLDLPNGVSVDNEYKLSVIKKIINNEEEA